MNIAVYSSQHSEAFKCNCGGSGYQLPLPVKGGAVNLLGFFVVYEKLWNQVIGSVLKIC